MASSSNAKGKGRQKIKMEKMKNPSNLQVTFSKRRNGAFKKAHELSILTGAEVASIVFSPGGKVYSYGHPTTDSVINRFLTGNSQPLTIAQKIGQDKRDAKVVDTNTKLAKVKSKIELEKKKAEELDKILAEFQSPHLGKINWDVQNLSQTQQLVEVLKNTKVELEREINAKVSARQNHTSQVGGYNNFVGESGFSPLSLAGATYEGNGSKNSYGVTYVGSDGIGSSGGGFYPSLLRPNGYGVGTGGNELSGSDGLGFYGNGGGLSFNSERSLFGGCEGGGGTFIEGSSSLIGAGGALQNTYMASSSGVGGGGTFIEGSSSLIGGEGGLPNTYMASSSGVGGGGLDWSLSDVPNPLGQFLGPSTYVGFGSGDGLPNTYGASSSMAGNGEGGCGGLPNTYMASSSRVGGGGLGWSLSNVPNPLGQFVGPSTYVAGGSGDGLPNTYGASSSGVGNGDGGSNYRVAEWIGSMPPNGSVGGFSQN